MTWLDERVMGFDLESTGVDPLTALPVSFSSVWLYQNEVAATTSPLVNPEIPIPSGATAIHGITDADVAGEDAWSLELAVEYMCVEIMRGQKAGVTLVGMNISYDLTLLSSCAKRLAISFETPHLVADLYVIDKHVDQYRKGKRTLTALSQHYGVALGDAAHNAEADVIATYNCLRQIAHQFPEIGQADIAELTTNQRTWRRDQQQGLSDYFVKKGNPAIPDWQMEWPVWGNPND
jgi:DNA polymerase III subunit epsilon